MGRLNKKERGGGGTQYARRNYKSLKGINLTVVEGMNHDSVYHVDLGSRTTSEERGKCSKGGGGGGFPTALGRIDVYQLGSMNWSYGMDG